jgi:hypothetical protein
VTLLHVSGSDGLSLQPLALLLVVVLPWLLLETWRSRRNEIALRAAGAIEPADDVYRWMRIVYPGMFVAMTLEGMFRAPGATTLVAVSPEGPFVGSGEVAVATGIAVFLAG